MTSLINYLANLNTSENQWGLFLNPDNIDEYRTGQNCFENGGLNDGWARVGSLDNLSFGFQSTTDAIEHFLDCEDGQLYYKGKSVRFTKEGLLEAYSSGNLDSEFQEFLESKVIDILQEWGINEASLWVTNVLPEILKSEVENV